MKRRTLRTITVTIIETWVLIWEREWPEGAPDEPRPTTYITHFQRRTTSQSSTSEQDSSAEELS